MIAVLVKIFGTEHLQLAEDVVQDALMRALETWKYRGTPDNPSAWLYRVARNKAIDIIRRRRHQHVFDFSDPQRQLLNSEYSMTTTMTSFWEAPSIRDDFLGMMFACCHPGISEDHQVTLILKTLGGLSTREIARAFLCSEQTISKRLYRAKAFFRESAIRPEIPNDQDLPSRLDAVLRAIYLMFNEGYNSTHAEDPIREDLIGQAMLLCRSLIDHERTNSPDACALMALMCFHSARIDSRIDALGGLIVLADQDRGLWDWDMIRIGNDFLNRAARGERPTTYHYEAAIAYTHCAARAYTETDWQSILRYYDGMLSLGFDPVVALNRCLVLLELDGPDAAMQAAADLEQHEALRSYYLYPAVLGAIHERMGEQAQAVTYYRSALKMTSNPTEQQLLDDRIASLAAHAGKLS